MATKIVQRYQSSIRQTGNILNYVAMVILFLLMSLGAAEVIGRYVFNRPITAVIELGQIMLAMMVFLAWAYTTATGGHVRVTLVASRFPPRVQAITDFVVTLMVAVLFGLIAWQGVEIAIGYWKTHRLVDVLFIPLAPFYLFVSFGAAIVCLQLIVEMLELSPQMRRRS